MRVPVATYRLQFHKDFRFSDAKELLDYLRDLGISDVYASPIFKARTGSGHGYDVVDHREIDPALGGREAFEEFAVALKKHAFGLILDIVPNHMGITEPSNVWWMDVLENGPSSIYSTYFDIDWQPVNRHLENRVLLPILEDQYGIVLEDGKLQLAYRDGAFFVEYYQRKLPVAPHAYGAILSHRIDRLSESLSKDDGHLLELQSILTAIGHLPPCTETDPDKVEEGRREKEVIKRRIATLYQDSGEIRNAIDSTVAEFNGTVGQPRSFDLLDQFMGEQAYRLAFWRVAGEEVNYRRFFDINELAAIRTEAPEVFKATHELIFQLIGAGKVTGLRVDHPDGLRDPGGYFRQLQQNSAAEASDAGMSNSGSSQPLYIVAEKILSKGEPLPSDWAIAGTTGYDFLNQVNSLFVRRASRRAFDRLYSDFIGAKTGYHELVNSRKKMIMLISLASEINALSHRLDAISERNRHYRDFTLNSLTFAIREVIACLSVYRTYADGSKGEVSERDQKYIREAVREAKRRNPRTARAIFDFIGDTLALSNLGRFRPEDRQSVIDFVMKFQQLSGPVMAKGVEDTAFYVYNRLLSLNEVGGEPDDFGSSVEAFHRQNLVRLKHWPHSMLTLSTHDTKRGEDARARIDVLSEIPAPWRAAVLRWRKLNEEKKSPVDGTSAPDGNDEYLFYQAMVGVWPVAPSDTGEFAQLRDRVAAYMQKAIKEAKVHTSWVSPNEAYDRAVDEFVRQVLDPEVNGGFLNDFSQFHAPIATAGMVNSLAQTLFKMTAPGVPDFYQGTELWDLSLVDPDNRRPVDFARRKSLLGSVGQLDAKSCASAFRELLSQWQDGRVKLHLVHQVLNFRRQQRELFERGEYLALYADGKFREHVCAFARRLGSDWVISAAPRLMLRVVEPGALPLGAVWEDYKLALPARSASTWRNLLTGEVVEASETRSTRKELPLRTIFASFPVALLVSEPAVGGKEVTRNVIDE
jgi:(1->4)-alpha-D-glucan 1-alpha-D-glucosylmutase